MINIICITSVSPINLRRNNCFCKYRHGFYFIYIFPYRLKTLMLLTEKEFAYYCYQKNSPRIYI